MTKEILRKGFYYSISYIISTFIIVYALQIPSVLFDKEFVQEYYYNTPFSTASYIALDFVLIIIYILIASIVIEFIETKHQYITVGMTSFLIGSTFCFLFRSLPKNETFFSRFFHTQGYASALYDAIYTLTIYSIYRNIQNYSNSLE